MMRGFCIRFLSLATFTVLPAVACTDRTPLLPGDERPMQAIQLALSLGSLSPETKMDVSRFTEMGMDPAFRGLADIRVIPFEKSGLVEEEDSPLSEPAALPGIPADSLLAGSYARFYPKDAVALPLGTGAALLYGRPVSLSTEGGDAATRHLNGSLIEEGLEGMDYRSTVSLIHFSPKPIHEGETYPEAQVLRSILDQIVLGAPFQIDYYSSNNEKLGTYSLQWNADLEDDTLRSYYRALVNDGKLMGGSGRSVITLIQALYEKLSEYNNALTDQYGISNGDANIYFYNADGTYLTKGQLYNGLRDSLMARIRQCEYLKLEGNVPVFKDTALLNYPQSKGLPEGCAMLRFTSQAFVIPTVDGVDNMAPMSAFCYPPALYYYANTTLLTSSSENGYAQDAASAADWAEILDHYRFGRSVSRDSKAVAFTSPLQYAVAMLDVNVRAANSELADNDGNDATMVTVGGESFPVTGIIVGGQYRQAFDFTPDGETQYFAYDNLLSGIYLTTGESPAHFRTLALQTVAYEDVYFCLEFQNNSQAAFYGVDGKIASGQKFYMVGKMSLPDHPSHTAVLIQDHITYLSCTVSSLQAAYTAIPDLGSPDFTLGIQAQVNWEFSTPLTVILE